MTFPSYSTHLLCGLSALHGAQRHQTCHHKHSCYWASGVLHEHWEFKSTCNRFQIMFSHVFILELEEIMFLILLQVRRIPLSSCLFIDYRRLSPHCLMITDWPYWRTVKCWTAVFLWPEILFNTRRRVQTVTTFTILFFPGFGGFFWDTFQRMGIRLYEGAPNGESAW